MRDSKIDIGRIDLTNNCSFFEVPSEDAPIVLTKMKRVKVGDRKVVVDHADRLEKENDAAPAREKERASRKRGGRTYAEIAESGQLKKSWKKEKKARKDRRADTNPDLESPHKYKKDDWRQFFEKD